jgi:hypothetical protein
MSNSLQTKKNVEQAYLLYVTFLGDAVKTAHAMGIPVEALVNTAEEHGWDKKVGELAELRKSDKPGDLERGINRAVNFAQAHRTRQQLERAIYMIEKWDETKLEDNLMMPMVDKKTGKIAYHFSARPLADLTAALEKAHMLTYLSLGDTAQDRARRKEETNDSVLAASAMHRQIAAAMADKALETSPKAQLLSQQMDQVKQLAPKKATNPNLTPTIPPLDNETTV